MLGRLQELSSAPIKNPISLAQLLRRTEIFFGHPHLFDEGLPATEDQVAFEVETRFKYEGYIGRQEGQVEKLKRMENTSLPEGIDDKEIHGLTSEVRENRRESDPSPSGRHPGLQVSRPPPLWQYRSTWQNTRPISLLTVPRRSYEPRLYSEVQTGPEI